MHSRSAILPQLFHSRRRFAPRASLILVVCFAIGVPITGTLVSSVALEAQAAGSETTYRVFLKNGKALPSYGEAAHVGDRLIFNLVIRGMNDRPSLQLLSLPADTVDLDKTSRYAQSVRAAYYAATRGAAEYDLMTKEVSQMLDQLSNVADRRRRLALAEQSRQRLLDWSRDHYGYRDEDIRELTSLFEDVISDMRVAAGESSFSFDVVAGAKAVPKEPLLSTPVASESLDLALAASMAADVTEERVAILRAAEAAASAPETAGVHDAIKRQLDEEMASASAYGALAAKVRARAAAALAKGDVAALQAMRAELTDEDRRLGGRRPDDVRRVMQELQAMIDRGGSYRLALDHYAYVKRSLLAYERATRPALASLQALTPVLEAIREMQGVPYDQLETAEARLKLAEKDLGRLSPPQDLAGVHSTFMSVLAMARQASASRRQAVVTNNVQTAREASSAAAGALLLVTQARQDLVTGLYPPKVQ